MRYWTNAICFLAGTLLNLSIVTTAQAASASADRQAAEKACSVPLQKVVASLPPSDKADALKELDYVTPQIMTASLEEVASFRKEMVAGGASPVAAAYLVCIADYRLSQRDVPASQLATVEGARQDSSRGPSSFASDGPADDENEAAVAKPNEAGCKVELGDAVTGALSTESAILTNHCPVAVGYSYCVKSENGGGAFSCDGQKFGSGWMRGGGREAISVALASTPFEVHWVYCLATPTNSQPLAVNARWDGQKVSFDCR